MRTSIEIDEVVLSEAKKFALDSKKSFGAIVEDALRVMIIKKSNQKFIQKKISLITSGRNGLNHGVDLDNNQSLLYIMDN